MSASHLWELAVAQLFFYIICLPFIIYVGTKHRHQAIMPWFFLFSFLMLQIVGSGLVVHAGKHGNPSETSIIILEVGISTLLLSLAGGMVQFMRLVGAFHEGNNKRVFRGELIFHLSVVTGIALYAVGAVNVADKKPGQSASGDETLEKAGIVLLTLLWVVLSAAMGAFYGLATKSGRSCAPLLGALIVSLVLLGVRVVFRCVATFDQNAKFNLVGGDIAYTIVLDFLPSLGIVVAMAIGGLMTGDWGSP